MTPREPEVWTAIVPDWGNAAGMDVTARTPGDGLAHDAMPVIDPPLEGVSTVVDFGPPGPYKLAATPGLLYWSALAWPDVPEPEVTSPLSIQPPGFEGGVHVMDASGDWMCAISVEPAVVAAGRPRARMPLLPSMPEPADWTRVNGCEDDTGGGAGLAITSYIDCIAGVLSKVVPDVGATLFGLAGGSAGSPDVPLK